MAFVSGPRQCGKTTLSKALISGPDLYFSWDQLKFRRLWNNSPEELARQALDHNHPRIVLDELHKNKKWKNELKGFYDEFGDNIEILVTGSARFNTYRKGGDSLLGRFYHFHLYPFSLCELKQESLVEFSEFTELVETAELPSIAKPYEAVDQLMRFGGFPEPLLSGRDDVHELWQRNRLELLVRQDLRDLSRVNELSQVEILASLLPSKVGSPLSVQSLREDLEVAFTTIQRWLRLLEALYYHFEIKPYSKLIQRSLKKEGKIYLFDWSAVEDLGARFENIVACHLKKLCDHWSDHGLARLELFYLRNKEKNEVDFIVLKNKKPWFTVEAKLSDIQLDTTFQKFQTQTKIPHFQIVQKPGIARTFNVSTGLAKVISFERFFAQTP